MTPPSQPRPDVPAPLTVAASVVGVEALGYGLFGISEFASLDADRPEVAVSTGIFFVALAGFLGFCAWRLWRVNLWPRAPIVMVQLIQVPVALNFWGGGWTNAVTIGLLLVSAIVLVGVFHPQSLSALEHEE